MHDKAGVADPDEVTQVVVNRSGSILSASTIIKSDFFSNLQKMTLPECGISLSTCSGCCSDFNWFSFRRIEGSPNFRRVPMALQLLNSGSVSPSAGVGFTHEDTGKMVCGR